MSAAPKAEGTGPRKGTGKPEGTEKRRVMMPQPQAAMAVVRAMNREVQRQAREGALRSALQVDANGMTALEGRLDLAMLAFVAEIALRQHFPSFEDERP